MKTTTFLFLISVLIVSCNKKTSSLPNDLDPFSDYRELPFVSDYEKQSDTSYSIEGFEGTHRITELRKGKETVILFNSISLDKNRNEIYTLIDTLVITDLPNNSYLTIGYCTKEGYLPEEIIALVKETELQKIENIIKAWRADHSKNRIIEIKNLQDLECFNEFFNADENAS